MATKFSPEEDEKLIDFVREHPPLYTVKSKSYKDNIIKNNIWKKIGEKLHKKDEECKLRWKSLRDYYQRKKKDYIKGTGTGSQRKDDIESSFSKKFQHLRFLDSTSLGERSTITNTVQVEPDDALLENTQVEQMENDEDDTQLSDRETTLTEHISTSKRHNDTEVTSIETPIKKKKTTNSKDKNNDEDDTQLSDRETTLTEHISTSKRHNDTEVTSIETPVKKKKTTNSKDKNKMVISEIKKGREERNALLRDLLDKQKTAPQTTESIDDPAINMFFKSVAATVSTFSPIDKAKIKAEVMSLVSKYEIEQITRQAVPISFQNQWPNNYSGHPSTSHRYDCPSTSNSADANFRSHTALSEATSYVFSPEPEIQNFEML